MVENLDYLGSLYAPNYTSINPSYGRRRLTFFNDLIVLDVYNRTLSFDDTYSLLFASNTVGMCGLVTQDVPNPDDDLIIPIQGGVHNYLDNNYYYNDEEMAEYEIYEFEDFFFSNGVKSST